MSAPRTTAPPVSNATRALWTFVASTLVGPAAAALILALIYLVSGVFGVGPPSLKGLKAGELVPYTAERALAGYVWSAIPAGVAGAVVAALVYVRGTFAWLVAVVVATVAATIFAVLSGGQATIHITAIAVIAALAAILVRVALGAARIIS